MARLLLSLSLTMLLSLIGMIRAQETCDSDSTLCSIHSSKIYGVNLGGWLVLEPWIRPSLFSQWEEVPASEQVVDEWTFTERLGPREASKVLNRHWDEWVTEAEIEELAGYGINHVRIPLGYWALDIDPEEPYVSGALSYLLRAVRWAGKYGIKVFVELHAAPGSQNGNDHSGRRGKINWVGNEDNVERTSRVVKQLAQVLSAPGIVEHLAGVGLINEPVLRNGTEVQDRVTLEAYYEVTYERVRRHLPETPVVLDTAFQPLRSWETFMQEEEEEEEGEGEGEGKEGNHSLFMDTHLYQVFDAASLDLDLNGHMKAACDWSPELKRTLDYKPAIVGEWSLAMTDCAQWLNGFGRGSRWDGSLEGQASPTHQGGSCKDKREELVESPQNREALRRFAQAQMTAYEAGAGWIFWNFKTEPGTPDWNFLQGVRQGYIPKPNDPSRGDGCNLSRSF
ncbi:MAG: glycoside hydrolase superfamily [Piptocephalis tieghemiana]|nr:MAG: glycoside hydrolase superfamily [Piptocephalis tieghemiana]